MPQPADFQPFSTEHLVALGVLSCLCGLVGWSAKRISPAQADVLGRILGISLVGYVVTVYLERAVAGELRWEDSLPLELCHWVLLACIVALFWPNRLAFEIAYFWGLGGTLQAVVTPDLGQGFPSWKEGVHDDEPTQHETVTTFPHAGHAAKQERDKQGQIGDRNHSLQRRDRKNG